jgi:hypothetical protein
VSHTRIGQNLNAAASGAVDIKMFNSVKAGRVRIAELERRNVRTFTSKVNKSIRGAFSHIEANTDTP